MARMSFSRVGDSVRIPVSATSGATPFDTAGKMPADVSDLTFMFVNCCPFDIRLEGFATADSFTSVTSASGWLVMARTTMGPFTSKRPAKMSAQAFASPGLTLPSDFTGCYIELIYGRGD